MKLLLLCLMLSSTPLFGQSPENSQPLAPEEKRQILGQLFELKSCREESVTLRQYVARDQEQDARERVNSERALELERRATTIALKERDLAREKADLYEQLYRSLTREPGIGCRLLRVFTLGLARCR